jgi:hypothetical protein
VIPDHADLPTALFHCWNDGDSITTARKRLKARGFEVAAEQVQRAFARLSHGLPAL